MIADTITRTPKWAFIGDDRRVPVELWFPKGAAYWRWNAAPEPTGDQPK
jgi:hypothetical protein